MKPSEDFSIEGRLRPDGKVYFTSSDLPGFRVLLDERPDPKDYVTTLSQALKEFYPLLKAAEARRVAVEVTTTNRDTHARASERDFKMVAHFAAA